jgi:hypothetical protein
LCSPLRLSTAFQPTHWNSKPPSTDLVWLLSADAPFRDDDHAELNPNNDPAESEHPAGMHLNRQMKSVCDQEVMSTL